MSRMIPNNPTTPTIMKLLFFSYLCARDPVPHPETNCQGIEIHLTNADKTTSAAPKIPNPNLTFTSNNRKDNVDVLPSLPRRSPRNHGTDESSLILKLRRCISISLPAEMALISVAKAGVDH